MGRWRRRAAENPIDHVGIWLIQQALKSIDVGIAEAGQIALGETADQVIGFAHAAMTALEQKLFDAVFAVGHRVSPKQ